MPKKYKVKYFGSNDNSYANRAHVLLKYPNGGPVHTIKFHDDYEDIENDTKDRSTGQITMNAHISSYPHIVDLLRNESNIEMTLENSGYNPTLFTTGWEKVGEGEEEANE